jgi:CRISPR-associated protein Cas2
MIIISYDISDNKLRTRFSKFISKYGHRIQYSVYEIDNSERILDNIITNIQTIFERKFTQEDSVLIFHLSKTCEIIRLGYAKNEESDIIII